MVSLCFFFFLTVHPSSRYFARSAPHLNLYTDGAVSRTQVDHWLTFSIGPLQCPAEMTDALRYLSDTCKANKFLVGEAVTAADYAIFGALYASGYWRALQVGAQELTTTFMP